MSSTGAERGNPSQTVDVRSSSTVALFDFGVNRLRIANLRRRLAELKIIR